jgi:hypothetical protein
MIQNKEKVESRIILGADVAKASIVLKQLRDGHPVCAGVKTIPNNAADITKALINLGQIDLIVCEVTGGYERQLLEAASQLAIPMGLSGISCVGEPVGNGGDSRCQRRRVYPR